MNIIILFLNNLCESYIYAPNLDLSQLKIKHIKILRYIFKSANHYNFTKQIDLGFIDFLCFTS